MAEEIPLILEVYKVVYMFNAHEAKKARLAKAKRFWKYTLIFFMGLFATSIVSSFALMDVYSMQDRVRWSWLSPESVTSLGLLVSVIGVLGAVIRHTQLEREERTHNAKTLK